MHTPVRKSPCSKAFQALIKFTSYQIRSSKFHQNALDRGLAPFVLSPRRLDAQPRQFLGNGVAGKPRDEIPENQLDLYLGMGFQYLNKVQMYYEDTGWTAFRLYEYVL